MDKIELLKAEIERRFREDYHTPNNHDEDIAHDDEIAQGVCASILEYINSLPEELSENSGQLNSEDLEKAAEEYAYTNWESDDYHEGASEGLPFDAIGHTAKCFKDGAEWQKEQNPKMIQWTGKNLKEVIDFTGKSPRFNEWFKSWEDFENYAHSHGDILKLFCEDGSHYEVPVGSWIVKTPDGFNIPSLFKFVQSSAEWSENDEAIANLILKELEQDKENSPDYSRHFTRLIDWFTNRLKSFRPSWKPSEEQMEALRVAAYSLVGTGTETDVFLVTLYDDLKKL